MKFSKYPASAVLQPYIKHYWLFSLQAEDIPFQQLFFPYGSHELVFYLKSPPLMQYVGETEGFIQEKSSYSGQFTKPFLLSFTEECYCLGISFHPWAGNALFGIPSYQCTDRMISLGDVEKDDNIEEQLRACAHNESALLRTCEEYLQRRLQAIVCDPLSLYVARAIQQMPTRATLQHILGTIGVSRRRVEQRFRESVGLSMGEFTQKVRFQKAVHIIGSKDAPQNLTQIGLTSGYYDQSHFIREFKEFSATLPHHFVRHTTAMKGFFGSLI